MSQEPPGLLGICGSATFCRSASSYYGLSLYTPVASPRNRDDGLGRIEAERKGIALYMQVADAFGPTSKSNAEVERKLAASGNLHPAITG